MEDQYSNQKAHATQLLIQYSQDGKHPCLLPWRLTKLGWHKECLHMLDLFMKYNKVCSDSDSPYSHTIMETNSYSTMDWTSQAQSTEWLNKWAFLALLFFFSAGTVQEMHNVLQWRNVSDDTSVGLLGKTETLHHLNVSISDPIGPILSSIFFHRLTDVMTRRNHYNHL